MSSNATVEDRVIEGIPNDLPFVQKRCRRQLFLGRIHVGAGEHRENGRPAIRVIAF